MTEPNYEAEIVKLTAEVELSKRVVTAHRRLCDERAAKIKELTGERDSALKLLAEKTDECVKLVLSKAAAEAIVEAAKLAYFPAVITGAEPDGITTITIDEWEERKAVFLELLSACREKGGAK